ncbi:IS3 family transposase [Rhabdaerophilum sp.]|uniref:IS3 family transposase n=1 Tax=Rhabdaerophilum sp. TaxID=2717341 RepID=UPI0038D3B08B
MVCAREQGEPERVFRFMSAHQAVFPIKSMARVFKVSASGYYAGRGRPASARASADLDLTRRIRTIHASSRGTYGAPRVHAEFKAEGMAIGKKRVTRLMKAAGIVGASRSRSMKTTRRDPDHHPANDLVRRNFFVAKPNELWVADITFVPTLAGFLFLAVVLDAWSRRIVGWAFSADLKTRVVLDALDMALAARMSLATEYSLNVAFEFSLSEHVVWPVEGAPSAGQILLDAADHAVVGDGARSGASDTAWRTRDDFGIAPGRPVHQRHRPQNWPGSENDPQVH